MELVHVRTISTFITIYNYCIQFLISMEHKRVVVGQYLRIMMGINLCVVFYVYCVWVFRRLRDARRRDCATRDAREPRENR